MLKFILTTILLLSLPTAQSNDDDLETKKKKDSNISILQMSRWEKVLKNRSDYAQERGLSEQFAKNYLQEIHNESIRQQTAIMNETELAKVK